MSSDMPASSKPATIINDALWLRRFAVKDGIPADCVRGYQVLFNQGINHAKTLIDSVIERGGGAIQLPMQPKYLEDYLTGYTFEYRTFCNLYEGDANTEGFWMPDPAEPSNVVIHYNRCATSGRRRYNQTHELVHFAQSIDPKFLEWFDDIITNTTLPEHVVVKLLHRITERTTAMYLMPNDFFYKKYREIQAQAPVFGDAQLRQLAKAFDVSVQAASIRVQEVLRAAPLQPSRLGVMPP